MKESDQPKMVKGVPRLGNNLDLLGRFTEALNPPKRQLRAGIQLVAYLMVGANRLGFGSDLWGQGILSSDSGYFYTLYQVKLSNTR